jgi:predicted ABC-type exoprotein transport system permease subunit
MSSPKYSKIPTDSSAPTGVRARVMGVINKLVQRTFINYVLLFSLVGLASFVVLHYWTDLFKHPETGKKKTLEQALAAGGIAFVAALTAFFTRML